MKKLLHGIEDNVLEAERILEKGEYQLDSDTSKKLREEFFENIESMQIKINEILLNK